MKNKVNYLLSIAALLMLTIVAAQAQTTATTAIAGSPYESDDYVAGEIHFGTTKRAAPIRYNIYQDVMEYKQNNQPLVVDPSEKIGKVKVGATTYVVEKFEFKGKTKFGFLALVDTGKVTLYSKKVVTYLDIRKGGALDGGDLPAHFTRVPDMYYYKIGDGEVQKLESIKSLIATLPEKKDELTAYAKKEKVSLRKEETLKQFLKYYNSL
jgi:hypothetical protein